MRIIVVLLLFFVQRFARADDEQDEWKYPEKCLGYACDYRAQWWYLEKTDEIKFIISTKFRNKWTGIGFSDGQQMKGTDAVLGLVEDNGRYFLMDTYLSNYQAPPLDALQNIHNMSVWRENGITHLQFHRFRTTSDPEYDFQFTDDHCAYFHFPIRGGLFNAVNKRMRKHEEIPIISKEKICIRSKNANKRKKVIEVPAVRLNNVPINHKPKIPNRFKARPKLTNLISTTTTTPNSIQFKSPEPTTNRKPILSDQNLTTQSVDSNSNNNINNSKDKSIDKSIEKFNDQTTSIRPTTLDDIKFSVTNSTQSTILELSSFSSVNENANDHSKQSVNSNSIETNKNDLKNDFKNEFKNDDKLEYGDEDEDTTNSTNENKKPTSNSPDITQSPTQVGRIPIVDNQASNTKETIKSFNFELKILLDKVNQPNSTIVNQEAEKELGDLTGFKQLKLLTLKPQASVDDEKNKITSWIADFEMQVQTEPDTNETDYLAYLQNALNETVIAGHIGNLILDTSHYAQLRQDSNQTKQAPEVKYVFEYNFFNQLTVKLTKEQLKLAYVVLGVSLLVLLVLMQACCMCCTSNDTSNNDLHKPNNLSNSSTLQDKHQLNMHHHNQYNEYIKNCGNNYSYENFALDASDAFDMPNSSYKMKHKHSLSKHDPMLYNNYHQNYSNSYNRRPDFGYNNGNFNNFNNNHHNYHHSSNHHSSSHHRYFEPQPMIGSEQPDFYFMPKQRIKHNCYN